MRQARASFQPVIMILPMMISPEFFNPAHTHSMLPLENHLAHLRGLLFSILGPTASTIPALGNAQGHAPLIFRGLKARDMERLAGNPPSHGSGFQPSSFMVMPLPMALPWAGMERVLGPEECQVIFRDSGSIPRHFKARFRMSAGFLEPRTGPLIHS